MLVRMGLGHRSEAFVQGADLPGQPAIGTEGQVEQGQQACQ